MSKRFSKCREKVGLNNQVCSRWSFLDKLFLHVRIGDPNVMARKSCGLQMPVQVQSRAWRFGVKWPITSQAKKHSQFSRADHDSEKSKDVLQQYRQWMEFISKYEGLCGEKYLSITLLLQNVKESLVQTLNVSVNDSTSWPEVHSLLISGLFQQFCLSGQLRNQC